MDSSNAGGSSLRLLGNERTYNVPVIMISVAHFVDDNMSATGTKAQIAEPCVCSNGSSAGSNLGELANDTECLFVRERNARGVWHYEYKSSTSKSLSSNASK